MVTFRPATATYLTTGMFSISVWFSEKGERNIKKESQKGQWQRIRLENKNIELNSPIVVRERESPILML